MEHGVCFLFCQVYKVIVLVQYGYRLRSSVYGERLRCTDLLSKQVEAARQQQHQENNMQISTLHEMDKSPGTTRHTPPRY